MSSPSLSTPAPLPSFASLPLNGPLSDTSSSFAGIRAPLTFHPDQISFICSTTVLLSPLSISPTSTAGPMTSLILSSDGFKSHQLLAITSACPNLTHLLATCVFHPRFNDFVGDKTLIAVALHCPRLSLLHLADPSSLSTARGDPDHDGFTSDDAMINRTALENLFSALPLLEELTLDICHNVMDTGPALEVLNSKCPGLKSLKLGQFHGICKAIDSQLDGIALCRLLESLSIKNTGDLTDSGLIAISRGCQRLARFEVQGCKSITETGVRTFACLLRQTLVDVSISCCKNLDATSSLRALEPIRDRIQRLHIDCVWDSLHQSEITGDGAICQHGFEPNESREDASTSDRPAEFMIFLGDDGSKKKRCKYSGEVDYSRVQIKGINCSRFWRKTWDRLRYLSLWIAVGELLNPLASSGLDNCPVLEEIRIRVEGDCRMGPKPTEQPFGLSSLARYPRLSKMQLDCGDAIGYALTAPTGHMDLSLWERVYLMGIENLKLTELDYWPPQDRDVNQRSLSLPAAGLLAQCTRLRKLFIHGTAYEHFMMFFLGIPNLRDVQLREDYYPAPENDMSTEMRVDSCSRFEQALNKRQIGD
uniref:F-box/LRR-repeat MAX2 homolog A-like n=1 Tax=Nelumbo nucifera TaxID=4432 RepID=A0A822XLF6_NELNU|nr:TPA_asm: hypothetical protein HUJ06_022673 [Nelumbo nucifera]